MHTHTYIHTYTHILLHFAVAEKLVFAKRAMAAFTGGQASSDFADPTNEPLGCSPLRKVKSTL